jgi:protein-S-isoprenylcysteine O-methyltransferase Ste14
MVLLKSLLLFLFVALSVFVASPFVILFFTNGYLTFHIGIFKFLGVIPVILGAAFALWVVLSFAFVGKGTPAPFDPTKKLVTEGLFKYSRNPMYLGAVLVLFGETIFFQSLQILVLTILFWIFFHVFVVYYEEPNLRQRFGGAYEKYLKTVPRWLPKLFS